MITRILSWILFSSVLLGCSEIKEPVFREIRDFHIDKSSLSDVSIRFKMAYFNPNGFSVSVKETAVKVYVENVYLGEFTQDNVVAVGENAAFEIPLSGEVALSSLLTNETKKLLKSQVSIKAEGNTKIGKAGIFIKKQIRYQGQHRLDASLFP